MQESVVSISKFENIEEGLSKTLPSFTISFPAMVPMFLPSLSMMSAS
jgi:hypothetical protein